MLGVDELSNQSSQQSSSKNILASRNLSNPTSMKSKIAIEFLKKHHQRATINKNIRKKMKNTNSSNRIKMNANLSLLTTVKSLSGSDSATATAVNEKLSQELIERIRKRKCFADKELEDLAPTINQQVNTILFEHRHQFQDRIKEIHADKISNQQ